MKIVIVGAGIVGASIAYNLAQRPRIELTVIEKASPGAGASGHSFAWTNAFGKEPEHYFALNHNSMEKWHAFARDLGVPEAFQRHGRLLLENTEEGAERLRAHIRRLQDRGYGCRMVGINEVQKLEPGLNTNSFTAASFTPIEGHVDVPRVIDACLAFAAGQGAELLTGREVTGFRRSRGGTIEAVETTRGDVPCDAVVVAAGTSVPALASHAGVPIPQPASPGIVVRTDPRPRLLQSVSVVQLPALSAERPDIHLRQTADGVIQIGQGTQESLNEDDSQEHADDLLDRAMHYLPALKGARAIPQPVGLRPMPADGLPVIGFAKAVPNMYLALMHSGVTLAPLVGEVVALEMIDGASVEILTLYRVERFAKG